MAVSSFVKMIAFITTLSSLLLLQGALGEVVCEELPVELCAYAISNSGKRCVLENSMPRKWVMKYQCRTSEVMVDTLKQWIETEECINACGVERSNLGISSDHLLSPKFIAQICSQPCFLSCPNIVDLYSNLAQAEGMDLKGLCSKGSPRRSLLHPKSSSEVHTAQADAPIGVPVPVTPPM